MIDITSDGFDDPGWSVTSIARVAVGVGMVVTLTSAPFVSLSRWVARVPLTLDSWPYLVPYGVTAIAGTALFLLEVVRPAIERRGVRSPAAIALAGFYIALAAWTIASSLWTDSPDRTQPDALFAAGVVLGAIWFGWALTIREQVMSLLTGVQSTVVVSAGAALVLDSARFEGGSEDNAWIGLFNNPNTLMPVAGLGALVCVGCVTLTQSRRLRVLLAACIAIDVVVVAKSFSSTGAIALVAGLAVFGLVAALHSSHVAPSGGQYRLGVATAAAIAAASPWIVLGLAEALGTTMTGRTVIWRFSLEMSRDRRLAGFGYRSFWDDPEMGAMIASRRQFRTIPDAAHSTFFETLLGVGLVGLVSLTLAVAVTGACVAWSSGRGRRTGAAIWSSIAAFALVENLTESMIAYHSLFWFLLVAAGFGALQAVRERDGSLVPIPTPTPDDPGRRWLTAQ